MLTNEKKQEIIDAVKSECKKAGVGKHFADRFEAGLTEDEVIDKMISPMLSDGVLELIAEGNECAPKCVLDALGIKTA